MWDVNSTEEYLFWFSRQDDHVKEAIFSVTLLLREFGPLLKRPYADTLKGCSIKNMKELRIRTPLHVIRIAYYFDENRKALLLIGGDKKGKNEKDFYKKLIADAEALIRKYRGQEEI